MNSDGPNPRPWSRARWFLAIAFVFAAQIGLIFAVSDRKPMHVRRVDFAPELQLPAKPNELLALTDPTLFALPSTNGFSAATWMESPHMPHSAFEWIEPDRWLPLPAGQLGEVLMAFMQTNRSHVSYEITRLPPPEPTITNTIQPLAVRTRLRVNGDLAQRAIESSPSLPVLPYSDLLQDSVVQVFVDDTGNVVTAALLPPGSGSDQADQQAVRLAKAVRFTPLNDSGNGQPQWTRGALVFQWATKPATNTPAAAP